MVESIPATRSREQAIANVQKGEAIRGQNLERTRATPTRLVRRDQHRELRRQTVAKFSLGRGGSLNRPLYCVLPPGESEPDWQSQLPLPQRGCADRARPAPGPASTRC